MKRAIGLLLAIVLAGCATETVRHPTKGQEAYYQDLNACEQGFAAMQDRWAASYAIRRCLGSKGWQ